MGLSDIKAKAAKLTNPFEGHATPVVAATSSNNATTAHQALEVYQAPPPYTAESSPAPQPPPSPLPNTAAMLKDGTRQAGGPEDTLPVYDPDNLMNTPNEDLTPEQRKMKDNMRILNTPDEQLGITQRKLKEHIKIMNTPDEELDQERRRIKARMKLMYTPDEQLTPGQRKQKKHMMHGKGGTRYVDTIISHCVQKSIPNRTTAAISLLQGRRHCPRGCFPSWDRKVDMRIYQTKSCSGSPMSQCCLRQFLRCTVVSYDLDPVTSQSRE